MMQSHVPSSHSNSMPVQVFSNSQHLVLHCSRSISLLRHSQGFSSRFSSGSMTRLFVWVICHETKVSDGFLKMVQPGAGLTVRSSPRSMMQSDVPS